MANALRLIRLNLMMGATLLAPSVSNASPVMLAEFSQGLTPLWVQAAQDDELLPIEEDKDFQSDGNGGFERSEGGNARPDREDFDDDEDFDDEDDFEQEGIPLNKVPKAVVAAFKKQFGNDAQIHEVYAESEDGNAQEYFIGGESQEERFVEMTVGADGEVYGYAQEIDFEKAPKAVRSAALKAAKGNDADEVLCILFKEEGETYYEVAFESFEETGNIELAITEGGAVMELSRSIDPSKLPSKILKLLEGKVGRNASIEEAMEVETFDEGAYYVVMGFAGNKGFEFFASSDGSEVEFEFYDLEEEDEFEDDEDFEDDDE